MTYAKGTTVTVDKSQIEIAAIFGRYGVETYGFGQSPGFGLVEFQFADMPISLKVPLPVKPASPTEKNAKTGLSVQTFPKWEADVREAWRALVLFIKAALESCERGIVKPEQAFMAFLVGPDGRTVGDMVLPAYMQSLETGQLAIGSGR